MPGGAVSLVFGKTILGILPVQVLHEMIPGHLGNDGSRCHSRTSAVSVDQIFHLHAQDLQGHGIGDGCLGPDLQMGQAQGHGGFGRLVDVQPVDFPGPQDAHGHTHRLFQDFPVQDFPPGRRDFLGIVEARQPDGMGQDHSSRYQRTGQRSPARFIAAGHLVHAPCPEGPFQILESFQPFPFLCLGLLFPVIGFQQLPDSGPGILPPPFQFGRFRPPLQFFPDLLDAFSCSHGQASSRGGASRVKEPSFPVLKSRRIIWMVLFMSRTPPAFRQPRARAIFSSTVSTVSSGASSIL